MFSVELSLRERRRILENVGFLYRGSQHIFVRPESKQVLTDDFVEAAHQDDLECAVRAHHLEWVVHSHRQLSTSRAAAILRAARRIRSPR